MLYEMLLADIIKMEKLEEKALVNAQRGIDTFDKYYMYETLLSELYAELDNYSENEFYHFN